MPTDRSFILVCATGKPEELAFFGAVTTRMAIAFPTMTVRCLAAQCPSGCSPELWLSHWPGMDIVQLADVVVGGGGYNLVQECTALGIPLVAFVFPRKYDRQARRIREYCDQANSLKEVIVKVSRVLLHSSREEARTKVTNRCQTSRYTNGVGNGVKQILAWISQQIH